MAKELGIDPSKVKIYPYKAPKGYAQPTPMSNQMKQEFDEDKNVSNVYTYYGHYSRGAATKWHRITGTGTF